MAITKGFGMTIETDYDEFKGRTLPPAVALERHMATLGVPEKQTDKARQVFQRSADEAGFFKHGRNRLVEPVFKGSDSTIDSTEDSQDESESDPGVGLDDANQRSSGGGDGGSLPPLLKGLVDALPAPDSEWAMQQRFDWLQLANQIFKMTYKSEGMTAPEIQITLKEKGAEQR